MTVWIAGKITAVKGFDISYIVGTTIVPTTNYLFINYIIMEKTNAILWWVLCVAVFNAILNIMLVLF